jgi:hypothetical protein
MPHWPATFFRVPWWVVVGLIVIGVLVYSL